MNKILLLFLCFIFTSCFDVTERIYHKNNNSGNYTLVVDFSKSWFKTKSAIWLEEVDGVTIPNEDEIKTKLAEFRSKSSQIEGISNISTKYDFNSYIFTFKFSYNSIKALNSVLNSMDKSNDLVHFANINGNFERIASYPIPKKIVEKEDKKEDLLQANIIAIYSFEKEVSKIKNQNAKVSKSNKTVFLKQNVWSVLKNNTLMNNTISFTP